MTGDPYEALIDAVLYPGAYHEIETALEATAVVGIYRYVYLTRSEKNPEWRLVVVPHNQASATMGQIENDKASGIFMCPYNSGLTGVIESGQYRKYLYGVSKWQQSLVTVLYNQDVLPHQCNAFAGELLRVGS